MDKLEKAIAAVKYGIRAAECAGNGKNLGRSSFVMMHTDDLDDILDLLKAQEPDESKYEYHTDHTDCPWYISGEESKCPVTCSQYRDGWNDAMNYIFQNGDGYRPYDRIRKGR